jgi:hypothetical protein
MVVEDPGVSEILGPNGELVPLEGIYFGGIGLASEWLDARLSKAGIGWVSACLFARVNANGEALDISFRGKHPSLATDADEAAAYPVEEGAFYGNYFTPPDQPFVALACEGRGQASGEFGGLVDRDCTELVPGTTMTQCGFTYAGSCFDVVGQQGACKKSPGAGGGYNECSADGRSQPKGKGKTNVYREVITTFVKAR